MGFSIKAANGDVLVFPISVTIGWNISQEVGIELYHDGTASRTGRWWSWGWEAPQRRISVVGAVTSVDVKDIQTPATSINNMLGGRIRELSHCKQAGSGKTFQILDTGYGTLEPAVGLWY